MAEGDAGTSTVSRWFTAPVRRMESWDRGLPSPVGGNKAVAFVEPGQYYAALGAAVRATRPRLSDFVYLAGWELDLDTFVDSPDRKPRQTLRDLLIQAAPTVDVRTLLDSTANAGSNEKVAADIAAMKGGAIVDPFHQITGSQHQKIAIIRNANGVIAFCGGMDIANHRLGREGYTGPPITPEMLARDGALLERQHAAWHDVQVSVEGPAAADIWQSFVQRWKALTLSRFAGTGVRPVHVFGAESVQEPDTLDSQRNAGPLTAHVVRTYANITVSHFGLSPSLFSPLTLGYPFAPQGERGNYDALVHAIDQTVSTIYLEDQYLVNSAAAGGVPPITEALRRTISKPTFKAMVIAIAGTGTVAGELYQAASRRREFIQQLGPDAGKKVATYAYSGDLNSPFWFHAKTWIFDDQLAVVTSANCNRRSYTCDAELGIAIAGAAVNGASESFAHALRVRLWLKHLNARPAGVTTPSPLLAAADVEDFVAAAPLWEKAPLLVRLSLDKDMSDDIPLTNRLQPFLDRHPLLKRVPLEIPRLLVGRSGEWALIDPDGS